MTDEKPEMRNPSKFYGNHFDKQNCLTMEDMVKLCRQAGCIYPITAATFIKHIPDMPNDELIETIQNDLAQLKSNRPNWWKQ